MILYFSILYYKDRRTKPALRLLQNPRPEADFAQTRRNHPSGPVPPEGPTTLADTWSLRPLLCATSERTPLTQAATRDLSRLRSLGYLRPKGPKPSLEPGLRSLRFLSDTATTVCRLHLLALRQPTKRRRFSHLRLWPRRNINRLEILRKRESCAGCI